MTDDKTVPKSRSGLKGQERERLFLDGRKGAEKGPETGPEKNRSRSRAYRSERFFWPPQIRWAGERGWLNVQDPTDGSWHQIWAKDAPHGWVRLAQQAKAQRQNLQVVQRPCRVCGAPFTDLAQLALGESIHDDCLEALELSLRFGSPS